MREATPVVSYVIRTFPKLSETFVVRELLALQQAGVPLEIWSLLPAGEDEIAAVPAAAPLLPLVRTAPGGPLGVLRMIGDLFRLAGKQPVATAKAVGWAIGWSVRERDARHLAALPYAAHLARNAAAPHLHAHFANTPATTAVLASMLSGKATGDPGLGNHASGSGRGRPGGAEPRLTASYTGHARDLWVMTSPAFLAAKTLRCTFAVSGTQYAVDQIRLALRTEGGAAPDALIDPVTPSRRYPRTGSDRRRAPRGGDDRRGGSPGSGRGRRAGRAPLVEVVTNSVSLPEIAGEQHGDGNREAGSVKGAAGAAGADLPGAAHDPALVVATARLVEKKGLDILIRAIAQLAPELPALRLELIGDGPLREELEALARELELEDRVLFHGALPNAAVGEVLSRAGVFTLPARTAEDGDTDGLPVAILEALAHGVPVVATPVAGIPEAVIEGRTGLIVAPNDVNATASAIRTLVTDDDLRRRLGQAGRQLVAERYDAATSAAALRRLFYER